MTKIFVAGATGYIGKNVVKSALEQNFKVVIATRKISALWAFACGVISSGVSVMENLDLLILGIRRLSDLLIF